MAKPKKDMNAFDLLRVERELQVLVGGYFDKAYQPSRDEVLLRFRAPGTGRVDVAVGLGRYVMRTKRPRDNPLNPPQFTQLLRKHLTGGKVLAVRQHGFDRVLVFEVGKADATYRLIAECFANGNVVLVKDDTIVVPLIHKSWAHREIRPGRPWTFPPPRLDPKEASEPEIVAKLRESDKDLVRTLATVGNLGPEYAEEVCLRAGVDKRAKVPTLDAGALAKIARTVKALLREVSEEPSPVVVRDEEGTAIECSPVPLRIHEELAREEVESLSAALDELFAPHVQEAAVQDQRLQELEAHKGRLRRQVEDIEAKLDEFVEDEARSRRAGDLLYAHFGKVEEFLRLAGDLHAREGWKALAESNLMVEDVKLAGTDPKNGALTLSLPDAEGARHDVTVWLNMSLGENAEVHYDRSKEMRDKQEGAREARDAARRELEKLDSQGEVILQKLEEARGQAQPTRQFWFDRFRWFKASTGHLVVGGRDARSNEQVVKKYLEDKDRYLHADLHGAPSVVVKAQDGDVPEVALEEAAQFAAAFSKGWVSGVGRGEAYWVTPPQVTRHAESGEFVPRGAFIIRGERNYLRADMRCGIGETTVEGHKKVMGGPVAAIEHHCEKRVLFEPGRTPLGALASVLADAFEVPVEEVQRVLPPGPVRILEVHGLDEAALREVEK